MALYMPASARRRRLIVVAVVAVIVGVVIGWGLGRATAPTLSDEVGSVRSDALLLDSRLQSLPFEYDKALGSNGDLEAAGGPVSALDGVVHDTEALTRRAVWLGATQRAATVAAVQAARDAAASGAPSAQFQSAVTAAQRAIGEAAGLPSAG